MPQQLHYQNARKMGKVDKLKLPQVRGSGASMGFLCLAMLSYASMLLGTAAEGSTHGLGRQLQEIGIPTC